MHTEPIAHIVGDVTVRIDDAVTVGPDLVPDDVVSARRIYTFRVTKKGVTTAYRCKVTLADVIKLDDQQLAEYLVKRSQRRVRLFGFLGDAIP